jgi:hypothetical protein
MSKTLAGSGLHRGSRRGPLRCWGRDEAKQRDGASSERVGMEDLDAGMAPAHQRRGWPTRELDKVMLWAILRQSKGRVRREMQRGSSRRQ